MTILAGAGCEGAHDELARGRRALRAPIVHALRGKEFVEYDNPYDVGMTGLLGFASGYRAMEHCDTLLMLGTDFPYAPFYPGRRAGSCRSTCAASSIGRRTPVDVAARRRRPGHASRALLPLLPTPADDGSTWTRMLAHYRRTRAQLDALAFDRPRPRPDPSAVPHRARSTGWPPTTPSSSPTSARRRCGRPATCG